jgi:hypothetical protein
VAAPLLRGLSLGGGQSNQTKACIHVTAQPARALGNAGCAGETQNADRQVAQGRHEARPVPLAHLTAVLIEGHISDPVERVLDSPVTSHQSEDVLGCLSVPTMSRWLAPRCWPISRRTS